MFALLALLLMAAAPALAAEPPRPVPVSVDDLPIAGGPQHPPEERRSITQGLLDALARHKIHAVALVTWKNVEHDSDLELLKMWVAAGHELGNHTWTHLSYTDTDTDAYIADVERARAHL